MRSVPRCGGPPLPPRAHPPHLARRAGACLREREVLLHLLALRLQVPLARRPPLGLAAVRGPGFLQRAVGSRRLVQLALQLKALALCRGRAEGKWVGWDEDS